MIDRFAPILLLAFSMTGPAIAGFTSYGVGCPDNGGTPPILSISGYSSPGSHATLEFDGAAANSYVLIMVGSGPASVPGTRSPRPPASTRQP